MSLSMRGLAVVAILFGGVIAYLFIRWRRRWTPRRSIAFGAGFGVWNSLLLPIMCVGGAAALPGAWLVDWMGVSTGWVGLRTSNFWLPAVAIVNAVIYGAFARLVFECGKSNPGKGHCAECGYNLTGNVSGVCPECGLAIRGAAD